MGIAFLPAACLGQELTPSTAAERQQIEAQVRACGFPVRNVRWTRIDALDQWELGFDTDPAEMQGNRAAKCVSRIGDDLISPRRLDVMISYAGIEGPSQ